MKKITFILTSISLLFMTCSAKNNRQITINKILVLNLKNQNNKTFTLKNNIKTVIFSFTKKTGRICDNFFSTKTSKFIKSNHILYVADISKAPFLIKEFFILPDLRKLKFTVLIIDKNKVSQIYKPIKNANKIMILKLRNKVITNIDYVNTKKELIKYLQ